MPYPLYQVDAFTSRPFGGNPAAVCLLPRPQASAWLQAVAQEMNLSETAFLVPTPTAPEAHYQIRWFTPKVEVDLCGHATLASAHVLWEQDHMAATRAVRFTSRSGVLTARRHDTLIELDFPIRPTTAVAPPPQLLLALGLAEAPRFCGRSGADYLLELPDEQAVASLSADHTRLRTLALRAVIVTAKSTAKDFDFVSRFFAPGVGIDEDPVTGSAHCALAPYWQARLGKQQLRAFQASPRGGELQLRLNDQRVLIAGHAITVLKGELCV
jgi:PhzF family phenazine biosynthesis protein